MEPDLKALYESHYERFCNICEQNRELDDLIWLHFSDDSRCEYYRHCKQDYWDEGVYENAFDILYKWDAEGLYHNPFDCLDLYLHAQWVK